MTDSRALYLHQLAEDYGIPMEVVLTLADLLGEEEDYDGLVTELDDLSQTDEYL